MTLPIAALGGLQTPGGLSPLGPTNGPASATPFQDLLLQSLGSVEALHANANTAVQSSLVGDDLSMVETFTAVREADLALKLMLQVRNKLVEAYQEVQNLRM